ncbi:MAG: hypothetical protein KKE17_13145 [Proteobacteria bacterium]|nr:hypothetical protein [Pseudomonadota bacterium]MBU1710941.1 hypothetical protein [Pseudomonadota bacterium]
MDFQGHLENVLKLFKKEPFVFIIGGFLVQVMITFSLGFLSGPVMGAYILMMVAFLRDNKRPEFGELFSGFKRFGELFPFFFLSWMIIAGFILMVIPGLIFMTMWLYVLVLMVDRKLSLGLAMRESRAKVSDKGFFMHFSFVFVITIVPSFLVKLLSTAIPVLAVLQILLLPLQCGAIASLYLEQFEGIPPRDKAVTGDSDCSSPECSIKPPPEDDRFEEQVRKFPED